MKSDSVRIDRWLCAARIFKSRTLATDACTGGHVSCNDTTAKPHHPLRPGDCVEVRGPRLRVLEVVELEEKRQSAPRARELYEDHSPPPPPRDPRDEGAPAITRGAGRPTKRDRRTMRKIRGR
ncbi:MAG: RNA-binding S4 domain-containing protein [Deltaproteobacteria bacterium]|nr:RNA-binding S4 domain-containing protein [Deltaproteobacteria bacterium]